MPRDARSDEVSAWLTRARADLRAAEVDLAAQPPLLADAAFHCQQAAEKAMKAFLVAAQRPFAKTHDLRALGDVVLGSEPDLEELVDRAAELTEYAWRYRYPGEEFEPPEDEVREALATAGELVTALEQASHGGKYRPASLHLHAQASDVERLE